MASDNCDPVWRSVCGPRRRGIARHKDQKSFRAIAHTDSQTPKEETDTNSVARDFSETKESFSESIANRDAQEQIKAQKNNSDPNTRARRSPSATPAQTPAEGKKGWPNVSLSPDEISGYEKDPPKVRQILDAGLALTKQNLGYTYGSADPANGGMDCSGFIYYVLKQNGFPDVPRDSSRQYVWVRKAGNFYAVLSRKEDSFEFDDLSLATCSSGAAPTTSIATRRSRTR